MLDLTKLPKPDLPAEEQPAVQIPVQAPVGGPRIVAPQAPAPTPTPSKLPGGCCLPQLLLILVAALAGFVAFVGFLGMIGLAPYLDAVAEKIGLFVITVLSQNNPAMFGYQTLVIVSLFFLSWLFTLLLFKNRQS